MEKNAAVCVSLSVDQHMVLIIRGGSRKTKSDFLLRRLPSVYHITKLWTMVKFIAPKGL